MSSIRLASLGLAAAALCGTAGAQIWVSPSGNDANPGTFASPKATIEAAAAAAPAGGTVFLTAGTFVDDDKVLTFNTKNLIIQGQGPASVIQVHPTATVVRDAGFTTAPVPADYRPVVLVEDSILVQFRNLTIDGAHNVPASGRLYGVFVRNGADVRMDAVEIVNCSPWPLDGNQRPAGVVVRGDDNSDSCNVEMVSCVVTGFGKVGVVSMFNSQLTMDSCNVDGAGHTTLLAQNGVQVAYDADAIIRNNTITDIFYSPQTTAAAGVLGFDAGSCSITDNYIGNCEGAIFMSSATSSVGSGTIRGNDTVASRFAITMDDVSGYSISGNVAHILSDDFASVFDNTAAGNDWEGNSYSDFDGGSPFPILGGTTDVDNNPRGGVDEFDTVTTTTLSANEICEDIVTADFDGDGMTDFAQANSNGQPSLTVGFSNGDGTFSFLPSNPVLFGNANGLASAIVAGEFDGNPGVDVAVFTRNIPPATTETKIYVFSNDGSGQMSLAFTTTLAILASGSNMAAGDLNSDGLDDLVVTDAGSPPLVDGTALSLINLGGSFAAPIVLSAVMDPGPARACDIADIDGDGVQDIVVVFGDTFGGRYYVLKGLNTGFFSNITDGTTNLNPREVIIDDIDGDGDKDFLVASFRFGVDFGSVEVFENDGAENFAQTQILVDQGPVAIATGDVGVPGTRRDIAVASFVAGNVTLLGRYDMGVSSGGIADQIGSPAGVALGEFTGDTYGDMLIADAASREIRVLHGRSVALAELYGAGCPGLGGIIPTLVAIGAPPVPIQPNPTFGLAIEDARANTVAIFAAGLTPAPVLIPCQLMISNVVDTWWELTSASGRATISVPIPGGASLLGAELFFQAGALDAANTTAFVPGFSLTPGMRIRVGFY